VGKNLTWVRVASPPRLRLLALVLLLGSACRHDSLKTRRIVALMDDRAEQTESRRCVPTGGRYWRAGLRQPVRCSAKYAEGTAIWQRDVWGAVETAVRTWRLSPGDSVRWPHLRDSVTALVAAIAGGGPCASRETPATGSREHAWYVRGHGLAVTSLERSPGGPTGYELRLEVVRDDTLCTLSRRRATAVYSRIGSGNPREADSTLGVVAVLDGFALAAGLPLLRTAALPAGERELRFSPGGSGKVWQPIPILRLIENPIYWVTGELFYSWPRLHDSTGHHAQPSWAFGQSGCRIVQSTAGWAACRVDVQPETTWRVVADSFQALGIWELPLGGPTEHGGSHDAVREGVLGEVLIEDRYGRFMFDDSTGLRGDDADRVRAAAALVRTLFATPADSW
jgi:hypothetical protein